MKVIHRALLPFLLFAAFPVHPQPQSGPLDGAREHFRAGRFDQAQDRLREVRRQGPDKAEAAYLLGRIALHRHREAKAADRLQEAVSLKEKEARYHYWLGRAYGERAKHTNIFQRAYYATQTKKQFEKALEADPGHLHARVALVMYTLRAPGFLGGSRQEAEAQTREVARRSRIAGLRCRGLLLEQVGKPRRALALYRKAVEEAPESHRPHRWLAGLLREMDRHEEAFAVYERRMGASSPDWAAYYEHARTALETGKNLERAEQALRTYLDHGSAPEYPARSDARFLLGQVLKEQGRGQEARAAFRRALRLAPDHPQADEAREHVKASIL